uniref:Uncharacterized protein n=1 Tax=Arundo donax TaxID=35708 RepID=A0A0A9FMM5_ARUDO
MPSRSTTPVTLPVPSGWSSTPPRHPGARQPAARRAAPLIASLHREVPQAIATTPAVAPPSRRRYPTDLATPTQ